MPTIRRRGADSLFKRLGTCSLILLIFPNQLFDQHPGLLLDPSRVVLIEDSLFFGDKHHPAKFHKQKLWLHRATMKRYQFRLSQQGLEVDYLDYAEDETLEDQIGRCIPAKQRTDQRLCVVDPADFLVEKRLTNAADRMGMELEILPSPGFLNTPDQNRQYRDGKKRWFMADFYRSQRQRLDVLIEDGEPVGGQWSFDEQNRKKVPKSELSSIPENLTLKRDSFDTYAKSHVQQRFADNPGQIDELYYPTSHEDAKRWLTHFLKRRFSKFGDYEDAIVEGESWLWHSMLTPSLNIGLLTPEDVVSATTKYAAANDVPINSVEGFLRQVIGWREFMRATYDDLGVPMRTTNHWNHHRPMPNCFYDGTTGVAPIDDTIRRLLKTGYCHHIERLMVLGGFMFLCEIDPDDIYTWFMEMFVDSYDWVMVPNVYAMSQNADGGSITTKPYFSGSSYIRKMSHYKKAPWCDVWDGLYWRWIWNHVDDLAKNPRWAMMCAMAKKMDDEKREQHLRSAETFLGELI
ncbi:Deoxyribodipyrimidine photo-lyase-related protein [Rubripirellula lacrimiformis]|uniref:Deoxyribodipyrimidine photo-lyase-related protein n=1 Tax=Rubripirellula lacrimiformis TaxID=1930273 RepID=A0A517ND11_9BACT|nr:Deoxyribodipyrimidine photo-lyase-related protein [Rubripirellula lacrimiformis]